MQSQIEASATQAKISRKRAPQAAPVAIIDTREQNPLDLEKYGLRVERRPLPWGDYSLRGLEKTVAIERKSLDDFMACVGSQRVRFDREILALRGYTVKMIVCEFNFGDILGQNYRARVHPSSVIGSIERWMLYGISFIMAGSHAGAEYLVSGILQKLSEDLNTGMKLIQLMPGILEE